MSLVIPEGKLVDIFREEKPLVTDLLLEDAVTIDLSSSFAPLIDNSPSKALTVLSNLTSDLMGFGISGQFKQAGLQIWKGTEPMTLSIMVGLYMKTNAYTDVILPAKLLMKMPLPGETTSGGIGLEPPGPSILEALTENETTKSGHVGKRLSMRIGNIIYLKHMLIKGAQPTFSEETDENGYPIWIKMKLDILSIYTATSGLIEDSIGV